MKLKHIKEIEEAEVELRKLIVDIIGADSIAEQCRISKKLMNVYATIAGITAYYLTLED